MREEEITILDDVENDPCCDPVYTAWLEERTQRWWTLVHDGKARAEEMRNIMGATFPCWDDVTERGPTEPEEPGYALHDATGL